MSNFKLVFDEIILNQLKKQEKKIGVQNMTD